MRAREIFEGGPDTEVADAVRAIYDIMFRADSRAEFRKKDDTSFEVRYWGTWEIPADAEDDGDYDWEVPTIETSNRITAIKNQVSERFPNVSIDIASEEKNWITVRGYKKV